MKLYLDFAIEYPLPEVRVTTTLATAFTRGVRQFCYPEIKESISVNTEYLVIKKTLGKNSNQIYESINFSVRDAVRDA